MAAAEQKKSYAVIKNFAGLNTKANRTAIKEEEFAWIENAMPIGFGNIKVVPAQSTVKDSGNTAVSFANTVTTFVSANIGLSDYVVGFEDNGRAEYFKIDSATKANVAVTGTFSNAGVTVAQYKNERIIIGDPTKGLSSWDGNNVVSIGSVGVIGITNPGNGYLSAPSVTISAPNDANGVQATAVCTITTGAGSVQSINITAGGSGYTSVPGIKLGAPDVTGGTQAEAVATISGGAVVAVSVTTPGSGYTTAPSVTFSSGAAAATAVLNTGQVNSVTLTNAGTGYTSQPTITISAPPSGTTATAIASYNTFKTGTLAVLVTNGGTGYGASGSFSVTFAGGSGGSGAAGTAIVSGGAVIAVIMTNVGSGYTAAPTVSFTSGSGTGAKGTVVLNSDNIVDVATFSGRVWVAAGRTIYYSAAGSYSDFTSVSAGSFTLTDSTLHGNIQGLLSANNFLYIFGDDSINVFSDLRVSSTGQTLFTNTNVSASIGTKRIYGVFPYFRSVLFMNDYGMYALVGSTTSKISDQLDGVFPYIDFTLPITGGQVLLNNILCAAFNFTYNDPLLGGTPRQIQCVFFDKKWFVTSQGGLDYITSVPVSGLIQLYGVDDKALYKLYASTTANISSTIRTALMPLGDPIRTKQALKFGIEATLNTGVTMSVTVDSESGSSPAYTLTNTSDVYWVNNNNVTITWTNNASATIGWLSSTGYFLYKSDAQQYGKYLGLTMTSSNPAFVVNTFEMEHELRVRF
jgi:hypothetical protein